MGQGIESLPPWLQALATIVVAVVMGGGGVIAYARKKVEPPAIPGLLVSPAYAPTNDTRLTLESMQRIERFLESSNGILDDMREGQRDQLKSSADLSMALFKLQVVIDNMGRH